MPEPRIIFSGIGKRYGKLWALRNVDCTFHAGEVVMLIGPNASGKTTLIKCLLGLVHPTEGRITIGDTVIDAGVKIDNQVQIGHNVRIGEHTVIAGCVGISGSAVIGRRCMLGGMVGVVGHLEICDDVLVTGRTMISSSIRQPGIYSSALAADEAKRFRRNAARFQKLDELAKRVQRLEGAGDAPQQEADDD